MSPGLRLELKQSQQLVMTPQLQQAIRLLQLSNLELGQWLQAECEKNPLISLEDGEAAPSDDLPPEGATSSTDLPAPADAVHGDEPPEGTSGADGPELAPDAVENLYDIGPGDGPATLPGGDGGNIGSGGSRMDGPDRALEERIADRPSLRRHLLDQIGQMQAPAAPRLAAALMVEVLDEHGYLRESLDALTARLGIGMATGQAALKLLQSCAPTGVGARNLAECLGLQLAERDRLDPAMQAILDNLDLIGRGEAARLRRLSGLDAEDFAEALVELRTLDPRPCTGLDGGLAAPVIPDIFVRRAPWGGWHIELNSETLPRVLVDQAYAAELEAGGHEVRRFVAECRADASWLVKSLEQRQRTILKVATEIVRRQTRFFDEGVSGLAPMTLKMVSEATGMHESTASRVTSNKFMATERGIFELKFFFTNAVGSGNEGVAASSVRHRIKQMIDTERPDAVLSDDTICDILAGEGIEIARRTVAKYRKAQRIPSSVDRRRAKAFSVQS